MIFVLYIQKIIIKQSNQTKLKISLISLCGLNIKMFPFELGKPPAFSYFQIFSNLSPLFCSIWIRNEPRNGTWAAVKIRSKTTFLPSFVLVGLQGNPLPQVK